MIIVNLCIFSVKLYMPGSYVAFNLLPTDPFDLLASCIVSLTQRINKYVCMCCFKRAFEDVGAVHVCDRSVQLESFRLTAYFCKTVYSLSIFICY